MIPPHGQPTAASLPLTSTDQRAETPTAPLDSPPVFARIHRGLFCSSVASPPTLSSSKLFAVFLSLGGNVLLYKFHSHSYGSDFWVNPKHTHSFAPNNTSSAIYRLPVLFSGLSLDAAVILCFHLFAHLVYVCWYPLCSVTELDLSQKDFERRVKMG